MQGKRPTLLPQANNCLASATSILSPDWFNTSRPDSGISPLVDCDTAILAAISDRQDVCALPAYPRKYTSTGRFCPIRQLRRAACWTVSGKEIALPLPPPLRTVRESFPSYGSSLSKPRVGGRFHNLNTKAVGLTVTEWMQDGEIPKFVRPAINQSGKAVHAPPRFPRDFLVTDRTKTVLIQPEAQ